MEGTGKQCTCQQRAGRRARTWPTPDHPYNHTSRICAYASPAWALLRRWRPKTGQARRRSAPSCCRQWPSNPYPGRDSWRSGTAGWRPAPQPAAGGQGAGHTRESGLAGHGSPGHWLPPEQREACVGTPQWPLHELDDMQESITADQQQGSTAVGCSPGLPLGPRVATLPRVGRLR